MGHLLTIGAEGTPLLVPALGCIMGRERGACRAERGLGVWRALSLVILEMSREVLELSGIHQQWWVPG